MAGTRIADIALQHTPHGAGSARLVAGEYLRLCGASMRLTVREMESEVLTESSPI
jgi:hypothetical protein